MRVELAERVLNPLKRGARVLVRVGRETAEEEEAGLNASGLESGEDQYTPAGLEAEV